MNSDFKNPLFNSDEGVFDNNNNENTPQPNQAIPQKTVRLVGVLNYLGTLYQGVQKQWHDNTVQARLEEAFTQLQLTPTGLFFAGRTDSGVHAMGQVFHLNVSKDGYDKLKLPLENINALLPDDISIQHLAIDPSGEFHSTVMATSRRYRYCIYNNRVPTCWLPQNALWIPKPLDIELLQQASRYLLGEHNFSSFQCMKREVKQKTTSPVCNVSKAEWFIQPAVGMVPDLLCFDIEANRFIYKMVRSIVGTFIAIGHGDLPPEAIKTILSHNQRSQAGISAPARGLTMMGASYPDAFSNLFL